MLVVSGPDGEVLAQAEGYVTAVTFKDKRNQYGEVEYVTRAHTVRLG